MTKARDGVQVFAHLKALIYRHSGIHLTDRDAGVLRTRVGRRLRELGCSCADEYLELLQGVGAAEEVAALVDAITVNYTFFFREIRQFQFLGTHVFSRLLARQSETRAEAICGWSAGCSSGEEPYSIAMIFAEAGGPVERRGLRVLATDINRRVLGIGARGIYPLSRLSSIPQEYRYKYLIRDDQTPETCLRVASELRTLIDFQHRNILQKAESLRGVFDFVFCRNVMIYFDQPTQVALLRRFHEALRAGAYLFVGSTETLSSVPHPFHLVGPGIYRKS